MADNSWPVGFRKLFDLHSK